MAVLFNNDGQLDIRTLTTLGVSVKTREDSIGIFGSGFIYALATLLRNRQEVRVYAGDSIYRFSVQPTLMRGEYFDLIFMSVNNRKPKEIGVTTRTGLNWNLKHAYRELYSNCMDEGGEILVRDRAPSGVQICVMVIGDDFERVHHNRDEIILNKKGKALLFSNDDVEIYSGGSTQFWYRGIAAFKLDLPSHFTYNFKRRMDLTEDRTLSDPWYARSLVRDAVLESDKQDIIYPSIIGEKTYESRLDWSYAYVKPGKVFKEVVRQIRTNPAAQVSDSAMTLFFKHTEELSDLFNIVQLETEDQRKYFETALGVLKNAGLVPGIEKYEFVFVDQLPKQSGEAYKGKIIINAAICCADIKELMATILEEYMHLELHVQDCTRGMQNALFDIITHLLNK
jgi:hypothetical protein